MARQQTDDNNSNDFHEAHEGLKEHGVVMYEELAPAIRGLAKLAETPANDSENDNETTQDFEEPRYTFAEFAEHMLQDSHKVGCACEKVKRELRKQGYHRGFSAGIKAAKIENKLTGNLVHNQANKGK